MHLTLHLTSDCNMRCRYCYARSKHRAAMSEENAFAALELAAGAGTESTGIIFFGGEPLLQRPLIEATVNRASELEREGRSCFHFKITTNGLLLDQRFLEYSLENDILVAMSFDGVREAHDRHRRLANRGASHELLLPKLRMLLAARPYASVLLVVNPDTVSFLAESVSFLLEEGCRYLIVSMNYAAQWDERSLHLLERQYRKLGRLYVEWTREGRKFYLSPFEVKLSSHINRHCHRKDRCELGRRQLSVGPDGSLYPCVQFVGAGPESEWRIGHVTEGIDETARARIHDRSEAEKEPCFECAIRERCNHTCGCLNWQATGSINRVSPVLCRHEQILVPIADRVGKQLYHQRDPLFLHKHYDEAYPVLSLIEDARGSSRASG